ncbi:MAG: outer membrane protein assembly factor BamE [Nitrospira sp.]|nr:outer membrane protein assembly factor BamE [Nitrospira sp.]
MSGLAPHGLSSDVAEQPLPEPEEKPFLCRKPVRLTIYTGFALLFIAMLAWRFVPGLLDPTFEKHIQSKQVMVGMTKEQVLKAWGSPYTINVSHTKDGIRREEWIYEDWKDASTVKHRYLYFEENTLLGGWSYQ